MIVYYYSWNRLRKSLKSKTRI